jgi:hypothetical protein
LRIVGKSQPVLVMIHPIISFHTSTRRQQAGWWLMDA